MFDNDENFSHRPDFDDHNLYEILMGSNMWDPAYNNWRRERGLRDLTLTFEEEEGPDGKRINVYLGEVGEWQWIGRDMIIHDNGETYYEDKDQFGGERGGGCVFGTPTYPDQKLEAEFERLVGSIENYLHGGSMALIQRDLKRAQEYLANGEWKNA